MTEKDEVVIYIGDLTHNYNYVSNETMPLSAAFIKAYLCEYYSGQELVCDVFRYPDVMLESIKTKKPDIVMLSNYIWNKELSYFVVSESKKYDDSILTIMGGPNFPLDKNKQKDFMLKHECLDIYIMGEGEVPSLSVVNAYAENGMSIEKTKEERIESACYVRSDGEVYCGDYDNSDRSKIVGNLDDIPSPWLNGYLDKFFDGRLAPLVETTRGCPFKCSFCVQGTDNYRNIRRFSFDRIKGELEYIAKKIKDKSPEVGYLRIADSNFGMYKNDVDLSREIASLQDEYGWPTYIDATTGKNKRELILATVGNLNGSLVMYNSVQSQSPVVLENIKRKNIKPEIMQQIQRDAADMGVTTLTETILSLPGETLDSHKEGLYNLIRIGIKQFTNYQCMLLMGGYLETDESRERFGLETKYRVLPRSFGIYNGENCVEVEEIVTSTSSLKYEEYIQARQLHLILIIYYNGYRFEPLIKFLSHCGVSIEQWLDALYLGLECANGDIVELFDGFVFETKNELFDSREECIEFYSNKDNFSELCSGALGGNLLMKYFSMATFRKWERVVDYAFNVSAKLLNDASKSCNEDFFVDMKTFMLHRLATGSEENEILADTRAEIRYDFIEWIERGCGYNYIDECKLEQPLKVVFALSDDKKSIIGNALKFYGDSQVGLTKLVTRISYSDQIKHYVL